MPPWRHNLSALRLVERQLTSFPLRHWNVRNLTLQQECHLTSTWAFFRTFAWLYNAATLPASRLCSAGLLAIIELSNLIGLGEYWFINNTWGPFLESPGNLTGPVSYFEIKFSRKVCCVLTSNEAHFVSLANNFTVPFSKLLKLPSLMENKTA